jgi:phage terminase small subunit
MTRNKQTGPDAGTTLVTPPSHLDEPLRGLWAELIASLPADAAAASDAAAFELLVRLVDRMRGGGITASESSQLRQLLAEFGMTPVARRALTFSPFALRP